MDWMVVGTSILSSILSSGVLGYFAKKWYETKLQAQIEELKAQLGRAGVEHQIRFAHLHNRRSEAIANSYKILSNLNVSTGLYLSHDLSEPDISREQRARLAIDDLRIARIDLPPCLIYFPENVSSKIEDLLSEFNIILDRFDVRVLLKMQKGKIAPIPEWDERMEQLDNRISPILRDLAKEYRSLLQ